MPIDFYCKVDTNPYYNANEIELVDELEIFAQCIEMILTTRKGDVLGDPDFGANLEDYVWSSSASSNSVQKEILSQINKYCSTLARKIPYDIEVSFIQGAITDTMIVDLLIDNQKVLGVGVTPL